MTYAVPGLRGYVPEGGQDALPAVAWPWVPLKIVNVHIGESVDGDQIIAAIGRDGFFVMNVEG